MTPLQMIAMGYVLIVVDAMFFEYDAVPDPIGWGMIIAGLVSLRALLGNPSLMLLAGISLLVSIAIWLPPVSEALDESGGWALSLPALAFSFALCTALAPLVARLSGRLRVLRWAFVVSAAGPVLVFGGGVTWLRDPLAFVVVVANIYLVYLLFRASASVPEPGHDVKAPEPPTTP